MRGIRAGGARLALAGGLAVALAACGVAATAGGAGGETVTVLVPWDAGSSEYTAFTTVAGKFTSGTGIQVIPESTRALTQQLSADLAAGSPPDIADLPNPSAVDRYAGSIKAMSGISLNSYDEPWRSLAESSTGTRVLAVPVKVDIKSLLWFDTRNVTSPPRNWAELTDVARSGTPWCLGLSSGPTSGWPGADWIADIMLSTVPVSDYQRWLNGTLSWESPQVSTAWQTWGMLLRYGSAVAGGAGGALADSFSTAITTGSCQLTHGALSAIDPPPSATGYGYVPFPSESGAARPALVSGDFMAPFTSNPSASEFLRYLASPGAQRLWVRQSGGYAFSADSAVAAHPQTYYPPGVRRQLAALLRPGSGTDLCFTAADMMVPDVSAAFYQAVLDYVNNPDSLLSSLAGLQETQKAAGNSPDWRDTCAQP